MLPSGPDGDALGAMDVAVADNAEQHRYEIHLDGELAGFTEYRWEQDRIAFTHTEIDSRFEGMGLGSKLVSLTLDDVRTRGLAVLPYCPFVRSYIARHPDYLDLVPADQRSAFDLDRAACGTTE